MSKVFYQGYLDSLCGIYSILNADKIVNNSSFTESQILYNRIIDHLHERNLLRWVIINGSTQKIMKDLIRKVAGDRFNLKVSDKRGIMKLKDWWNYSRSFLEEKGNRAIILSTGGKANHLTTVYRMSERRMFLLDSSTGESTLNRSLCQMIGYTETDKYIIYPSQCWYLGKE